MATELDVVNVMDERQIRGRLAIDLAQATPKNK